MKSDLNFTVPLLCLKCGWFSKMKSVGEVEPKYFGFECPSCGQSFSTPDELSGRRIRYCYRESCFQIYSNYDSAKNEYIVEFVVNGYPSVREFKEIPGPRITKDTPQRSEFYPKALLQLTKEAFRKNVKAHFNLLFKQEETETEKTMGVLTHV